MHGVKSRLTVLLSIAAITFFHFATARAALHDASSCSIYDAIYKPHTSIFPKVPILEKPKPLSFTLSVRKPLDNEKGGSHRTIFFYVDAFDLKTGVKVSTLRMSDTCSNGFVHCALSTYEGQLRPNEEMKELKYGMGFDPVALRKDYSRMEYYGPDAPYAFILPDTLRTIYGYQNKVSSETNGDESKAVAISEDFVRYYTPEKVFPDFSGYDVWVLSSCDDKTLEEPKQ